MTIFMDSMLWVPAGRPGVAEMMRHHETVDHFKEEVVRNWAMRHNLVGFPRACPKALRLFGPWADHRLDGFEIDLTPVDYSRHPEPEMGEKQAKATSHFLTKLKKTTHGGGILVAPCGAGKTVMGVGLAAALGRSTLVLVHKGFLMDQFAEAFERFGGLAPDRIGRIQEDRADFGPKFPVVLAMIQTVLSRDMTLPPELFESFGTVIGDEIHRAGAATWREAAQLFPSRWRIGLTATPARADGQDRVYLDNFGPVHARITRKVSARYEVVPTSWAPGAELREKLHAKGKFNLQWAQTLVATNTQRNQEILGYLLKAFEAGRRIIVFSDRLKQLEWLQKNLDAVQPGKATRVVGGMSSEEVKAAGERFPILLATYGFASEGFDVPTLDTAFLASPRGKHSLEQSAGRLMRGDASAQKEFLVLDFADLNVPFLTKMAHSRAREARRLGWTVNQ